jgi:acetoacetyl-CoA synthetase
MGKLLWTPSESRVKRSNLYGFLGCVNQRYGRHFGGYDALYKWSVEDFRDFWAAVWDFVGVKASKRFEEVVDDPYRLPGAKWFSGARLNFAENLLRYRDDGIALIFKGEGQETVRLTYRQLYEEAEKVSAALRRLGIQAGDRVAGFMPNMPETVAAMLGATSLGAIWSSCSPDFGIKGVLDRFGQIRPRVLFVADGYFFKGKPLESLSRVREMIRDLPSIEKVVVVSYLQPGPDIAGLRGAITYEDFKASGDGKPLEFVQLPFDHPLYVMFTSGTTGLPKCLVQSAGGILMNHLKELVLHTDLKREDAIFYFTTCGWMMWNWLISSLAVGARVILFDGNPFYPDPGALWRLAQDERITIFGTSAGYIGAVMNQKVRPGREYDLTALRTITSTGSPLSEEGFEFVYREIKQDVQLASISGGSDINGCFALGNPLGPVYSGELQCRGLGMKVDVFDDEGRPVVNQQGELVCLAASPSMPIRFWDDPDGWKYRAAYFEFYPNVWRHGDYALLNERGGMVIYGRSDATLNPGGVRIGTAEIYQQVEEIDEIQDSIVVGQHWRNDIRIILFVVLRPGCELSDALKDKIRKRIRTNASPRHVPAKILQVPDVPYTLNMKKVELAVRRVIEGKPVQNRDALRNPEVLDSYAGIRELQED